MTITRENGWSKVGTSPDFGGGELWVKPIQKDVITVEDEAGLAALPVGAEIRDRLGDRFVRKPGGFVMKHGLSPWDDADLVQWLPAELTNPEILGEFQSIDLVVGDYVRIASGGPLLPSYVGLRCRVLDESAKPWRSPRPYLQPLDPRPDTYSPGPFHPFFWDDDKLEKIEDIGATFKVGDRVRSVRTYSKLALSAEQQRLGVIEDVEFFAGQHCVYVRRDDNGKRTAQHFAYRYELANDTVKPEPEPLFQVGDRVVVNYDKSPTKLWDGPATVTKVYEDGVSIKADRHGEIGFFAFSYISPLVGPESFGFEDNTLAVVMDEAGLDALPDGSMIAEHEADERVWVKVRGEWKGFNVYDGIERRYSPNHQDYFWLVKHIPS